MTSIEKKQALVEYLTELQADIKLKFNYDVCDNFSLDGFLEHIDELVGEINCEIAADEE